MLKWIVIALIIVLLWVYFTPLDSQRSNKFQSQKKENWLGGDNSEDKSADSSESESKESMFSDLSSEDKPNPQTESSPVVPEKEVDDSQTKESHPSHFSESSEKICYQIITPFISRENLEGEKIIFPDHSPVKFQEEVLKGVWFRKHSLNPILTEHRLVNMGKKPNRKFLIKFKKFELEGFFLKYLVIAENDLLGIYEFQ